MKIGFTHWVIAKGPPPSPLRPGHLLEYQIIQTRHIHYFLTRAKGDMSKIDEDSAFHLVISGLMGPWQSASQMLLNLNKKGFQRDKTFCRVTLATWRWNENKLPPLASFAQNAWYQVPKYQEQIGVELKTNYHLGTVSFCRPKRSVTQSVEFSCSTEQNFLHLHVSAWKYTGISSSISTF